MTINLLRRGVVVVLASLLLLLGLAPTSHAVSHTGTVDVHALLNGEHTDPVAGVVFDLYPVDLGIDTTTESGRANSKQYIGHPELVSNDLGTPITLAPTDENGRTSITDLEPGIWFLRQSSPNAKVNYLDMVIVLPLAGETTDMVSYNVSVYPKPFLDQEPTQTPVPTPSAVPNLPKVDAGDGAAFDARSQWIMAAFGGIILIGTLLLTRRRKPADR